MFTTMKRTDLILVLAVSLYGLLLGGCQRSSRMAMASGGGGDSPADDGGSADDDPGDVVDPESPDEELPPDLVPVTLAWAEPSRNSDGSLLTDLRTYRVHWGTSTGDYSVVEDVGNATQFTTEPLAAGTYHFVVSALDTSGNESSFSGEVVATIE